MAQDEGEDAFEPRRLDCHGRSKHDNMRMTALSRTPENPLYRWLVTAAVMCGSFMVVLDATVVNVALPKIMASFGVNVSKIEWIITAYLLTMAIMMPSVGWLSHRIGNKLLFVLSLSVFTAASALCGTAWNEKALIAFRILQGIGAGSLMPIAMVIIFEAFPVDQRGLAMGIYGIGATFGPVVGPTLGGYLTDRFSWHLIFFINVPVGLMGIILATLVFPKGTTRKGMHFDFWGFLSMAVALSCLLIGLSQGQQEGWTSGYILSLFSVALLAFAVFFRVELRVANPFIDLRVYKSFTYAMATAVFIIQGVGLFGATFLIPLFFETILDYTALQTGLLLLPMALLVCMVLPLAGRLADRMDARFPISFGVGFSVLSLYWLSFLNLHTSSAEAIGMLIMRGFGIGFIFPPIMNLALKSLPGDKVATGSGLMNVSRQVGGAFGVALLGTFLGRRDIYHQSLFARTQDVASSATGSFPKSTHTWFTRPGSGDTAALQKTLAALPALLKKKAMVASFDDCFLLAACIFALAIVPTVLLRKPRGSDTSRRGR
jgi:DHA2 family multidrug resistance protein